MKMAKLRRKAAELEARLEKSRQVWRSDQATLRALRDKHKMMMVNALYGRRGAKEARCSQCTTSPYPCPTRKTLDALLERRAS